MSNPQSRKGTPGVPSKTPIKDRHYHLLQNIEKGMTVTEAGVQAGFKYSTMNSHGRKVVETALKRQEYLAKQNAGEDLTIAEKIGLTREEILEEYGKVIVQDRDLSTKLKAMAPALRDEGVHLDDESTKVLMPVFQAVMGQDARIDGKGTKIHDSPNKSPENTAE